MQILVCRLKELYFGISTEYVNEITKTHNITPIPNSSGNIQGLINLRGEVLTLFNMYSLLKINDFRLDDCYNNTVILKLSENNMALMIDEIIGVTDITADEIQPTGDADEPYIESLTTVYDKVVNILDINTLFEVTEE